jgi:hypothetical protein
VDHGIAWRPLFLFYTVIIHLSAFISSDAGIRTWKARTNFYYKENLTNGSQDNLNQGGRQSRCRPAR